RACDRAWRGQRRTPGDGGPDAVRRRRAPPELPRPVRRAQSRRCRRSATFADAGAAGSRELRRRVEPRHALRGARAGCRGGARRHHGLPRLSPVADAVTGRSREAWRRAGAVLAVLLAMPVMAGPFAPPGDIGLRHDLELLNDSGAMNLPLTGWPLSWGDIGRGLAEAEGKPLTPAARAAWERVRAELEWQQHSGPQFELGAALAEAPRLVRTFEDTPRAEAQATAALSSWLGERVAVRLEATVAANPLDGDEVRPDGTYVALALGNWLFSAGWQERWWGPGRDGSLILSTSARPAPGFALQRKS